jgi:hypothetical protein
VLVLTGMAVLTYFNEAIKYLQNYIASIARFIFADRKGTSS